MAKLRIPPEALPALQIIAKLGEPTFASLVSSIKESKPTLFPPDFIEQLDLAKIGIPENDGNEILKMLLGLYGVKDEAGVSSNQLSEDIGEAAAELEAEVLKPLKNKLVERLKILLSFEQVLGVTTKAIDVMTEQDCTFVDSRILCDIRPIFTDSTKSASAAVIVHNLKIEFHKGQGEEHQEFYVALDDNDLEKLKKVIARAEEKSKALKLIVENAKLPILNP